MKNKILEITFLHKINRKHLILPSSKAYETLFHIKESSAFENNFYNFIVSSIIKLMLDITILNNKLVHKT